MLLGVSDSILGTVCSIKPTVLGTFFLKAKVYECACLKGSGLRRGSSEERINIIRRRRFDTEPTIET